MPLFFCDLIHQSVDLAQQIFDLGRIFFAPEAGIDLSCNLVHVVADVMDLGTELLDFLRWTGFDLRAYDKLPQVGCFGETVPLRILVQPFGFCLIEPQTDFIFLRKNSSFLPPEGGIGVRVLPASGAKISLSDACAIAARGGMAYGRRTV